MKIYFRKVDGKQAVFAEIYGTFYRLNSPVEHYSELPGEPLSWGEVNSRLKGRLSVMHFLDVTADQDTAEGEAVLRLPDPESLWKWTDTETWKKALARVEAEAEGNQTFQAFAHWWEYLRRSEVFQKDCEALRGHISADLGLAWAAFAGFIKEAYYYDVDLWDNYFLNFRNFRNVNLDGKKDFFSKVWDLPYFDIYSLLWPETTDTKNLATSYMAKYKEGTPLDYCLPNTPIRGEKWYFRAKKDEKGNWQAGHFIVPCNNLDASDIATALFQGPFKVKYFFFAEDLEKRLPELGPKKSDGGRLLCLTGRTRSGD